MKFMLLLVITIQTLDIIINKQNKTIMKTKLFLSALILAIAVIIVVVTNLIKMPETTETFFKLLAIFLTVSSGNLTALTIREAIQQKKLRDKYYNSKTKQA